LRVRKDVFVCKEKDISGTNGPAYHELNMIE